MKYDVVGIGGVTVDHLNVVDKFPEINQKTVPLYSDIQGGGQSANAIACLGRLGAKTAMIGTVGDGSIGECAKDTMIAENVDVSPIVTQKGRDPALSSIIIEKDAGTRTIIADRGALSHIPITDKMYEVLDQTRFVHSDAHFPEENLKLIKYAKEKGVKICLDAEPHTPNSEEFVKYADFLIVSRSFVKAKYKDDYEKALHDFIDQGAELAVITLGKYGAIGCERDKDIYSVNEYEVEPIEDTTGAGDVFHGAFLYGLLQDWDFKKTMNFSNVCGALKCMKIGARRGMPTLEHAMKHLDALDY